MRNYIVGIGEALWDMLPAGKQLGGAPANFTFHASQLGFPAKVVSAVGQDALGDELIRLYRSKEVPSLIPRVEHPTGTVQVSLDETGVPAYEIKTEVAWDYIPFTPEMEQLAQYTQVVCFGSLAQRNAVSRATIYRFLDAMPTFSDVWRVFDINLRQHFYTKEILHESLCRCNVLKINDEELETVGALFQLNQNSPVERCRELLLAYNLRMVILTCGENGSYIVTSDQTSYKDTPKVAVADTVGAGDAFTAVFMASIVRGKSITEAHQLAVDIAAFVCTQPGAMPVLSEVLVAMADS